MNKETIINQINEQYGQFIAYLNGLSEEDFDFRYKDKWSARQQLEHIVRCITPLIQVYQMPESLIDQTFGNTHRPNRSYQALLDEYLEKLNEGGKAPAQYVPDSDPSVPRAVLIKTLQSLIEDLNSAIDTFQETALESLLVPHPLLGAITLKEMLYNAIYHVQHHQAQTEKHLALDR